MIILKTPKEIAIMAEGGRILGGVLRELKAAARAGIATKELDAMAHDAIMRAGAKPAFLHYRATPDARPFPAAVCASVNETVVHGVPSDYILRDGDVLKLDCGVRYKGFFLDAAFTAAVGDVGAAAKKLIAAAETARAAGIREAQIGKTLGDIGFAIERVAKKNGCSVIEGLTGHGIGRALHEDPYVCNFGKRGKGEPLREGMVIAIEPMFAAGAGAIRETEDGGYAARDGSLTAHFEHTVAITKDGPRILTA